MTQNFDDDIRIFRDQAAQRPSNRYPEPIKQRALALVERLRAAGWSQSQVSEALGISWQTIRRWQDEAKPQPVGREGFRPVALPASTAACGPVLVSPSGWRIEGLSLDELCEVAGRLT